MTWADLHPIHFIISNGIVKPNEAPRQGARLKRDFYAVEDLAISVSLIVENLRASGATVLTVQDLMTRFGVARQPAYGLIHFLLSVGVKRVGTQSRHGVAGKPLNVYSVDELILSLELVRGALDEFAQQVDVLAA